MRWRPTGLASRKKQDISVRALGTYSYGLRFRLPIGAASHTAEVERRADTWVDSVPVPTMGDAISTR